MKLWSDGELLIGNDVKESVSVGGWGGEVGRGETCGRLCQQNSRAQKISIIIKK